MSEKLSTEPTAPVSKNKTTLPGCLNERLINTGFKIATIFIALFIAAVVVISIGRAAIYKVYPYERGLHLSGGKHLRIDQPGWHLQIPLWDTVIIVKVNERLGYIEQIAAMTSDDVTMLVSLQYTYEVTDPAKYALNVDNPERIVFEFVQGKLRDVINTLEMGEVMHSREHLNQTIMDALKRKEEQYGVRFVTVQIQSATPPDEVVQAIKDRMVALQKQEQAQAEAEQTKTIADAEFYAAQKRADAEAYQITQLADAEAYKLHILAEARKSSAELMLAALDKHSATAQKYLELLIAQELKDNSKWIISGEGTPIIDMR